MPPPEQRRPFPDKAHEDLATWVEETLSDLADSFLLLDTLFGLQDGTRGDVGVNASDIGDSLLLVDVLFGLLDQAVADNTLLRADLAALRQRVAALEPPPEPDPDPSPEEPV